MEHNYRYLKKWLEREITAIPSGKNKVEDGAKAECILILTEVNKGIEELQQLKKDLENGRFIMSVCHLINEILGENTRTIEATFHLKHAETCQCVHCKGENSK